ELEEWAAARRWPDILRRDRGIPEPGDQRADRQESDLIAVGETRSETGRLAKIIKSCPKYQRAADRNPQQAIAHPPGRRDDVWLEMRFAARRHPAVAKTHDRGRGIARRFDGLQHTHYLERRGRHRVRPQLIQ